MADIIRRPFDAQVYDQNHNQREQKLSPQKACFPILLAKPLQRHGLSREGYLCPRLCRPPHTVCFRNSKLGRYRLVELSHHVLELKRERGDINNKNHNKYTEYITSLTHVRQSF